MSKTEWHNVEMELVIDLTPELIDTMQPKLREALSPFVPWLIGEHVFQPFDSDKPINLHIEFKSSGYSDPGRWGSCPDDSQPPEGEDEREMDSVYLMTLKYDSPDMLSNQRCAWHDDKRIDLPRDLQDSLFAHFQEQVDEEELPDLDD